MFNFKLSQLVKVKNAGNHRYYLHKIIVRQIADEQENKGEYKFKIETEQG